MITVLDEQTALFSKTKGEVSLGKKDKKRKKQQVLQEKIARRRGDDGDGEGEGDADGGARTSAFTRGWTESLSVREALPIKQGGKVIKVKRQEKHQEQEEDADMDGDDEEQEETQRGSKKSKKGKKGEVAASSKVPRVEEDNGYDFTPDFSQDKEVDRKRSLRDRDAHMARGGEDGEDDEDDEDADDGSGGGGGKSKTTKANTASNATVATEAAPAAVKTLSKSQVARQATAAFLCKMSPQQLQARIADICTSITENPARSLKRQLDDSDGGAENGVYRMADLFDVLTSLPGHSKMLEMAMLSALLVFKDICPGYRIRPPEETDKAVQLKKETKKMQDFEFALLGAYQRYLKFLENKVSSGLGNPRKAVGEWTPEALFGLSALRCQCEVLARLPHFNFRTSVLTSVVARAGQPCEEVSSMCCATLASMFKKDLEGEASLDAVHLLAKLLVVAKYDVPVALIRTLEHVRLRVHADESKRIHQKAKQERRKRKKSGDEVQIGLLESSAVADKSIAQKFQADALHEICLIYFRVVKMKVGFTLLPVALEGLGRITHLINIDTVEDLISLMRNLIEAQPPAPPEIRLLCLLCALRTLGGPGEALGIDHDFFTDTLRTLMRDLPASFGRWDTVLECLELCLLKRREERSSLVVGFVRTLILLSSHLPASRSGITALSMAHVILLRYPRARTTLVALSTVQQQRYRDDDVEDQAMEALRTENGDHDDAKDDGSWFLPLLRRHADPLYHRIVGAMTSRDVVPIPLRLAEARCDDDDEAVMKRVEAAISATPRELVRKPVHKAQSRDKHAPSAGSANDQDWDREKPATKKQAYLIKKAQINRTHSANAVKGASGVKGTGGVKGGSGGKRPSGGYGGKAKGGKSPVKAAAGAWAGRARK